MAINKEAICAAEDPEFVQELAQQVINRARYGSPLTDRCNKCNRCGGVFEVGFDTTVNPARMRPIFPNGCDKYQNDGKDRLISFDTPDLRN